MWSRPPLPPRRERVLSCLFFLALLLASGGIVVLALIGLVELVRWIA